MEEPPRERPRFDWVRWALVVVASVPFLTAAVRAIANDWFPIGDSAQLYLRATDVGTSHHPWLGSWSSASTSLDTHINNPGPLYSDLIAPFAHVFSPGVGNVLGVAALNVACLVGAAVAARRIGGWRFERWVLVAAAGLAWSMGSELLFDIFQAHALLFPFLLMLVLIVGVISRHAWSWPWLAVVASLVLQTHISYAYIAGVLGVTMVGVLIAETTPPRWPAVRTALASRTAMWTALAVALLWMQSLLEQLFGAGRGNLARLAANAAGTDVSVGAANATKLVAAIVALPPWWTRPGFADTIEPAGRVRTEDGVAVQIPGMPSGGLAVFALVIILGLLALCVRRAYRRGDRTLRALATLSIAGVIGSVLALSELTVGVVGLAPHHTRWVFVIALSAHLTLVWTAVEWLVPRLTPGHARTPHRDDTTVLTAALVVTFSLVNVPMYAQQHGPTDDAHTMPAMRRLFGSLEVLRGHEPVLYRTDNLRVYEPYSSAVQLEMRDRGIGFRVAEEHLVRHLGEGRRSDGDEPAVLAQYEAWQAVDDPPGCLLARASAFGPETDTATIDIAETIVGRVAAAGFDFGEVTSAAGARAIDRELASRAAGGDIDVLREITYDGRLRSWVDQGWASGPDDVVALLSNEGPAITDWLDSVVALTVTPADVCAG
jgi:hypothetical protein